MEEAYKNAFSEVVYILQNSEEDIIKKIPNNFIKFLKSNMSNTYIVNIDLSNENWIYNLKYETKAVLALIYRDYLVSSDERKILLEKENEEQQKYEEKIKNEYNMENIFERKKSKSLNINSTNKSVELKKQAWYEKISSKIFDWIKKG